MNQADLEITVREQARQIRTLQEQMDYVLDELERTQIQTNRSIGHIVNIIQGLQEI